MPDGDGLDLVGIGKVAKAIPAKAWSALVETACSTFRSAIAPFTATTSGLGRLIEAKFDRMVDAEKVLAAQTFARAAEKVSESGKQISESAKVGIVVSVIEAAAAESDPVLRELWANLLAHELVAGDVHPEFPKVLLRLSAHDAKVLAQIADRETNKSVSFISSLREFTLSFSLAGIELSLPAEGGSFSHEHLANLRLIHRPDRTWVLTRTGAAFIRSVSGA